MKLIVVIPYFYPALVYGGAVFASFNLSKEISKLGTKVSVSTTNLNGNIKLDKKVNTGLSIENMTVKYYKAGFLPFFSLYMIKGLFRDIKLSDIVHVQSIYSLTTPLALIYSIFLNKPVLLSPRGSLTHWSFNHRKRLKLFWIKYLIKPFSNKLYWHATSEKEEKEIKAFFPKANIKLIQDGTYINTQPDNLEFNENRWKNQFYIAGLGRLHKVKGFDIIIKAMPSILKKFPNLKLIIGGNDEGQLDLLVQLAKSLDLEKSIHFIGNISGFDKDLFLKHAQCLVVPSHTENFGIVVVEALAQSTPVIASKHTPWKILEDKKAGLYVDNNPQDISIAVTQIINNSEDYKKHTLEVVEEFSWERIAVKYQDALIEILKK